MIPIANKNAGIIAENEERALVGSTGYRAVDVTGRDYAGHRRSTMLGPTKKSRFPHSSTR
jgi:hypothetical protein